MPFTRPSRPALPAAAIALFVAAWCLPVIALRPLIARPANAGATIEYGWHALSVAFSPVLAPTRPGSTAEALLQGLAVASGLTNVLFLAVAVALLRRTGAAGRRTEAAVAAAAAINLIWLASFTSDLRIGYYLWVGSFVILGLAVHRERHMAQRPLMQLGTPAA